MVRIIRVAGTLNTLRRSEEPFIDEEAEMAAEERLAAPATASSEPFLQQYARSDGRGADEAEAGGADRRLNKISSNRWRI